MEASSETIPSATVRTSVLVPLRFNDGFETTALLSTFTGLVDGKEHIALGLGDFCSPCGDRAPLVRIHSECLTGDVFGSQRCDCGPQLRESVAQISAVGGYVLYLRQEGRGIGLYDKIDAYALQDQGLDTFAANRALGRGSDERNYTVAAQMLAALGISSVQLLSNNPDKMVQLERFGIGVALQVPTGVHMSEANHAYLTAKVELGSHTMTVPDR
jgi:GTP cyclohydrolase II